MDVVDDVSSTDSFEEGVVVLKRVYIDDLDGYGMLNHTRYATLFDQAVMDYWMDRGWRSTAEQAVPVVRELSLTYHRPVTGVGVVAVRFWIQAAGSTSVTYCFDVRSASRDLLHAEGSRVLVNLDPVTLRPTPFTVDQWRQASPLFGSGFTPPQERADTGSD